MLRDFREFLFKQNAIALAIGVIIGAATGKVVSALADNLISPVIGELLPGGDWRAAHWELSRSVDAETNETRINAIRYGALLGAIVDFVIIAFVVYLITRKLIPKPQDKTPETKECGECREIIPLDAIRCKACAQPVV